jgi:hypothetical protein
MADQMTEPKIEAVVLRGPFTAEDFALLAETLRQIDDRHGGAQTFEMAAMDPTETAIESAEKLLRQALPDRPDRETTFTTIWER